MEAKITQAARQAVMAASQRLDSEEQVSKFLAHSRMMVALCKVAARFERAQGGDNVARYTGSLATA